MAAGLALGMALATPAAAAADQLRAASGEALVEQGHRVDLTMHPGHAEMRVRRTVRNVGSREDAALFLIDLPAGAVATALRLVDGHGQPKAGELLDAPAAERAYVGAPRGRSDAAALLSWRTQSHLTLRLSRIPAKSSKTVEYTLLVPTSYESGRDVLTLPRPGNGAAGPELFVRAASNGDRVLVDRERVGDGARVSLPDAAAVRIELVRARQKPLDGALGVMEFAPDKHLVHLRLEAAARLSQLPRSARVVVVVDGSRSVTEVDAAAQLDAARAYLGHIPDARVRIVRFDRFVTPVPGGFVPAAEAIAQLDRLRGAARNNGSQLDAALDAADALLASAPPEAPRRVLALTDFRVRPSLEPARLRPLPKSGALLHLATVREAPRPSLSRDDDHAWARLARATGGLVWHARASSASSEANEMTHVFEEWARPLRLERLTIAAAGKALDDVGAPGSLSEGESFEDLRIESNGLGAIDARAELWSKPVQLAIPHDPGHARRWAAMSFGSHLLEELGKDGMKVLATRGHVVSPVSSLLVAGPGGHASHGAVEWPIAEGGGRGFGRVSGGSSRRGPRLARPDLVAFLREAVAPAWAQCGGMPGGASFRVHTTRDEIVDVTDVTVRMGPYASDAKGTLERCVTEGAWMVRLSDDFRAESASYDVSL